MRHSKPDGNPDILNYLALPLRCKLIRIQYFRPAYGNREKMRVAKRDISYGNVCANFLTCLRHSYIFISKGRTSNYVQGIIPDYQAALDAQKIANSFKSPPLTFRSALPVIDVQSGGIRIPRSQGGADTGVHASTQQHHRARFFACQDKNP